MKLYTGTSGWAYKEWKGPFYPETIKNDGMLGWYAERLPAVEVNNTFYRMPERAVFARWREQVPPSFRFVLKASRRITHQNRLKEAGPALEYLLDGAAELGETLGAFLFQLPPFLQKDVPRLREFLALLPAGAPAAFEFRHVSWFTDEVYSALAESGASLCVAESGEETDTPLVATASWGYLRLRREEYDDAALASWCERVRGQAWDRAFVFFKHEDAATGPLLAARFGTMFHARAPAPE
ncbi:MAG TPA: DUF72 domain-containing protein [Thermoanaerobaculia bacterium]|nr:DUF72 domain-containing protein [Thermoanaerobaculia bacterium]